MTESNALTVPFGKFWVLKSHGKLGSGVKLIGGSSFISGEFFPESILTNFQMAYTQGMQIYFGAQEIDIERPIVQILEYKSPSGFDGTLAIEETTLPNEKVIVFPNPTDSQLTINSDKIFKVEVYDLQGRKMFETNSTSIDFSELKIGIYLVNLYDEGDRIVSTYKVIKK